MKMVLGFVGIQRRTASGLTPKQTIKNKTNFNRYNTTVLCNNTADPIYTETTDKQPGDTVADMKQLRGLAKQALPVCFYNLADTNIKLKVSESNGDSNIKSTSPHQWLH